MSENRSANKHVHSDKCWEPDSGCDMGRNEKYAQRAPLNSLVPRFTHTSDGRVVRDDVAGGFVRFRDVVDEIERLAHELAKVKGLAEAREDSVVLATLRELFDVAVQSGRPVILSRENVLAVIRELETLELEVLDLNAELAVAGNAHVEPMSEHWQEQVERLTRELADVRKMCRCKSLCRCKNPGEYNDYCSTCGGLLHRFCRSCAGEAGFHELDCEVGGLPQGSPPDTCGGCYGTGRIGTPGITCHFCDGSGKALGRHAPGGAGERI